ncbi:hypothetical protein AMAG_12253 [Allomyces macrogynus ATCC 38327]|uniref:Uncharacterized protein n=1 Tax=Allomyces macrogynus (strain ATCC 38327) TaxID=578462 RepID=A0A0L0SXG9_ALLM3|nr:hypothetical protein AMAG_12253 [Allomyces macrogynus ATCC 38327]|eukprot:KNE67186.1 hypothetical protein AMAG_12253 [Allomyces macrogynus ATCC 38327]
MATNIPLLTPSPAPRAAPAANSTRWWILLRNHAEQHRRALGPVRTALLALALVVIVIFLLLPPSANNDAPTRRDPTLAHAPSGKMHSPAGVVGAALQNLQARISNFPTPGSSDNVPAPTSSPDPVVTSPPPPPPPSAPAVFQSVTKGPHLKRTRFARTAAPLWTRSDAPADPSRARTAAGMPLLVLVAIKDRESYGRWRSFEDLATMIMGSLPDPGMTTLAVLISAADEYASVVYRIEAMSALYGFAQIDVYKVHDAAYFAHLDLKVARERRHDDIVQVPRRRRMAVLRNTLMSAAMDMVYEKVLWVDADVVGIPNLLAKKAMESGRDIVVPACFQGNSYYDWNTFVGRRTTPGPNEAVPRLDGTLPPGKTLYVPRHVPGEAWPLSDARFADQEWVELTSVGGTWLMMSADVVHAGVTFGIYNVVGDTWDGSEGYDAIETESVCFVAARIGKKCWGLPSMRIQHS